MSSKVSYNVNIWQFHYLSNKVNLRRLSLSQTFHGQDIKLLWTRRQLLFSVLLSLLHTYPVQLLRNWSLEVLVGISEEGPVGKDTGGWGSRLRQFWVPLPHLSPWQLHFYLFDINFCLRRELCCFKKKKKTEKDKEEKWTLKITDLTACEVTCAFSLPQQAFQDEVELLSVALEIWPRGLVFKLFLVLPINENSLTLFFFCNLVI